MDRRAVVSVLWIALGFVPAVRALPTRNVLLITIDTIRADHLSCNGSVKLRTPHLDRLAGEGVNFTRARSPVPLTLPAHASILTGNYPPTHTVRSNGEYRLPDSQISVAEVLKSEGFDTAAFLASFVLDRRFGLAQGFDHYDDRVWGDVDELEVLEAERTGEEVLARFAAWLSRHNEETPFFVWIHLYDPHAPYEPPEPFRSQYPEDLYSGEVAYTDSIVGRILAELESENHLSKTLVAVSGDHGEGLGEHGEVTHSLLIYNSTLHVPLMLWRPGLIPGGREVSDLVRIIDLAPTILDYLGQTAELGEGISLRPLIEGEAHDTVTSDEGLTAYSESIYPELALGWSPLRGLETDSHRLILAPRSELYQILEDPGETVNKLDTDRAEYGRLKRRLVEVMGEFERNTPSPVMVEAESESRTRLESLGYLSASGAGLSRRGPAPNPMESVELWDRIQRGIFEAGSGDHRRAVQTFSAVLEVDPMIPLVYEYLGSSWRKLSADDRAEQVYRKGLSYGLESPRLHSELGRILLQKGEIDEAEREMQAALALDSRSVVIHYDLGNLYRSQRDYSRAARHYEEALEINPSYIWGWNGLAMSLAAQNRGDEALSAFRRVVEIDPGRSAGFFNLAVHLDRSGHRAQAVEAYERFLELADGEEFAPQIHQAQEALRRLAG